jgi:hypothetical protein
VEARMQGGELEPCQATESTLLHSAVHIGGSSYVLPPLTAISVVDVSTSDMFEYLPGKFVHQRLITVRIAYIPPSA